MLIGVKCSWLSDEEQRIPTETCQACARTGQNPCGYPLPFIRLMTRDRKPETVGCSSTMLGGCPREQGIKKNQDWYVNPDRAYTRAYGSAMHLGLETVSRQTKECVEERFGRNLLLPDGRTAYVTAQLDARYLQQDGSWAIHDYKVVATLADSDIHRKVLSYLPQFSTQRWILAGQHSDVSSVNLHFLMQKNRRVVNVWPHGEEEFPDGLLWSLEKTEAYLLQRLPALLDSLEGRLAPPLVDKNEWWRCTYCDVRHECEKAYGQPLPIFTK